MTHSGENMKTSFVYYLIFLLSVFYISDCVCLFNSLSPRLCQASVLSFLSLFSVRLCFLVSAWLSLHLCLLVSCRLSIPSSLLSFLPPRLCLALCPLVSSRTFVPLFLLCSLSLHSCSPISGWLSVPCVCLALCPLISACLSPCLCKLFVPSSLPGCLSLVPAWLSVPLSMPGSLSVHLYLTLCPLVSEPWSL